MGCITSKNLIQVSENHNPNRFDVIFADSLDSNYYNGQLEINGTCDKEIDDDVFFCANL